MHPESIYDPREYCTDIFYPHLITSSQPESTINSQPEPQSKFDYLSAIYPDTYNSSAFTEDNIPSSSTLNNDISSPSITLDPEDSVPNDWLEIFASSQRFKDLFSLDNEIHCYSTATGVKMVIKLSLYSGPRVGSRKRKKQEKDSQNIPKGGRIRYSCNFSKCQASIEARGDGGHHSQKNNWLISHVSLVHTGHVLPQMTEEQKKLHCHRNRRITEEQQDYVRIAHSLNNSAGSIWHGLCASFGKHNVTVTPDDIHNLKNRLDVPFKTCDMEILLEKLKNEEFWYDIIRIQGSEITSLIFGVKSVLNDLAYALDVVLFDPTYAKNYYDLPLTPFTAIHPSGNSVIVAIGYLQTENGEDIAGLFDGFRKNVS